MVIDVMVAAEFLFQAGLSEEKRELASTFVHRRMLPVEMAARRITSKDVSQLKRYDLGGTRAWGPTRHIAGGRPAVTRLPAPERGACGVPG
jgi:hypothetical protein